MPETREANTASQNMFSMPLLMATVHWKMVMLPVPSPMMRDSRLPAASTSTTSSPATARTRTER